MTVQHSFTFRLLLLIVHCLGKFTDQSTKREKCVENIYNKHTPEPVAEY